MATSERKALDGVWTIEFYSGKKLTVTADVFEAYADPATEMPMWLRLFTQEGHILIIPRESIATIEFVPRGQQEWPVR